MSKSDASMRSHSVFKRLDNIAESQLGASDGISTSVALLPATPAADYVACQLLPVQPTAGSGVGNIRSVTALGATSILDPVDTGALPGSLSFLERVIAETL